MLRGNGGSCLSAKSSQPRTKLDAQPRNLVAAAQAEQMAALVASIQAPLLDRIEEANRALERERVQRETIERERDELQAKVTLLREIRQASEPTPETVTEPPTASPAAPEATEPITMAPDTLEVDAPRRRWWARLVGGS
jgi:hypothetical protein